MKRSRTALAGALLATLLAVPAAADPIPVPIVSGTWLVQGLYPSAATFDLVGADGSRFTGRWPYGSVQAGVDCSNCPGGTSVTPAAFYTFGVPFLWGDPYAQGTAVLDGVSSDLLFGGTLSFAGTAVTLPQSIVQSSEMEEVVSVTLPFQFHGPLDGYELFGYREAQLRFSAYLTGEGLATIDFLAGGAVGQPVRYLYLGTRYDFQTPVPEPASLVLLGSGLIAGATAARGRRRQRLRGKQA